MSEGRAWGGHLCALRETLTASFTPAAGSKARKSRKATAEA